MGLTVIPNRPVKHIILHCSASDERYQSAKTIDEWHKARGFDCIGYHAVIRSFGTIDKGRDLDVVGAHCEGYNTESLGICLVGLRIFYPHQFESLKLILTDWHIKYPMATVHGHCEFDKSGKTCPVFDTRPIKDYWEQLK